MRIERYFSSQEQGDRLQLNEKEESQFNDMLSIVVYNEDGKILFSINNNGWFLDKGLRIKMGYKG